MLPAEAAGEDLLPLVPDDEPATPEASAEGTVPEPIADQVAPFAEADPSDAISHREAEAPRQDDDHHLLPLLLLGLGGAGLALAAGGGGAGHGGPPAQVAPEHPVPPTTPVDPVHPAEPEPPTQPRPPVDPGTPVTPIEPESPDTPPTTRPPTTATSAPVLTLRHDSGAAGDGLTNDGTVVVSALAEDGRWQFRVGDGAWQDGRGDEIPHAAIGPDGQVHVQVRQITEDGRTGDIADLRFHLDTVVATPTLRLLDDTGTPGDHLTHDPTLAIAGLETGATWSYSLDGGATFTAGNGTQLPGSAFTADGPAVVLVRQTDAAGNTATSAPLTLVVDTTVATPTLALKQDTGVDGDRITADGTVLIGGLEAGATWSYSLDQGRSWQAGQGDELPPGTFLHDGAVHLWVRQTDAAGNVSPAGLLNFTLQTQVGGLTPTLITDTGALADDLLTRDARVRVLGLDDGARWEYRVSGDPDWQTGLGDEIAANRFPHDGTWTVEVRQIDQAGNVGDTGSLTFTLDTRVGTPTASLALDSGRPGDLITNDPTVDVAGLESSGTWDYRLGDTGTWTGGSGTQVTGAVHADGDVDLQVRQTDLAGNLSTTGRLRFTLDTDGSASGLHLTLKNDSGTPDDFVSNALDVVVHGVETGASWEYQLEGAADWTDGVLDGDGGAIPASLFQGDGDHVLLVRQIDAAGNPSEALRVRLVLDTQVETPTLALADDTGSSATDGLTRDATVRVSGLESGASWAYSLDAGVTWTRGSGTEINANVFSDGAASVRVHQIDAAGNQSADVTLAFTVDTGAAAPGASLENDTGFSATDRLTRDAAVRVDGLETDARWQYRIGAGAWVDGVADGIAADRFGPDGAVQLRLRQIDAAGNTSTTQLFTFDLDTHVDAATVSLARDSGASGSDGITRDASITVDGLEAGARWQYSLDGGTTFQAGSGSTIPAAVFTTDGKIHLLVRQTDGAGNSADTTLDFTRLTSAGPLDLSDLVGQQDQTRTVLDGRAAAAGAPLTALQGRLTTDDAHELRIVLGGSALDLAHDRWVLDTAIALDSDAAAAGIAFGGLTGLSYRYDSASRELRLWHTDGSALSGGELTALTNAIRLRNSEAAPLLGERRATLTIEDMAGNVSEGATVILDIDTRLPQLDLNGGIAGQDADSATARLDQAATLFAADLRIGHDNPAATVRDLRLVLSGPGASRDDQLVSTDQGVATVLATDGQTFHAVGVDWILRHVSDSYTLARADGSNAAIDDAQALLRTLGVRNTTAFPLQGDRTFAVVVTDQHGRIARASGTVTFDTVAPAADLNGSAPGVDRTVVVTPGLPWAFAVAHPATGAIAESDTLSALTLRFGATVAGAFDIASATAGEWIGLFDPANGADRGAMLRLGTSGVLQSTQLVAGKVLTLTLSAGATPTLTVTADMPLSADEASQVLRALYYTCDADAARGARTVSVGGTDRAGNTTTSEAVTTLDLRSTDTPVITLTSASDTGLHANDTVTRLTGSAQAPLTLAGFATAGRLVTVFEDRDGNGQLSAGEALGTTTVDATGRWTFTLAGTGLADGTHLLGATDGRVTSGLLDLTVDTRPPASTFSLGQSVKVRPLLSGIADPGMAVSVELDTDGDTGNGYELRYVTRTDEAGRWTLDTATATPAQGTAHLFASGDAVHARVTTQDLAGNETVRTASSVAVDAVYSVSDAQVIEGVDGQRELVFLVSRTGDLSVAGSVHYAVDPDSSSAKAVVGGAAADNDYAGAAAGTLDFAAGESSRLIRFTVNGDHYREVNDKLIVRLDSAVGGDIKDGLGIGNIGEIDINQLQAAYGLRNLNPRSNDFAIRVRRASDNAEQDIGFDADGDLDTDALLAFVGTGAGDKGFVARWYDQSGHGRDMTQADTARQGVIVDGGRLVERADGSVAISFNSGRNGVNNDCMVADGIAANDWRSAAFYAKVQSEGNGNGTLFNFGDANLGRLSSHYPATREGYVFDVGFNNLSTDRLTRAIPSGTSLTGLANDIVFEAHAGNTGAGTPSLNYTDGKQVIYENGVQVTSDGTLSDTFSTTAEWKLAWHGAYPYGDSNYYQQAMYNEFLVYLAKDNSTPDIRALQGTTGNDVLTFSGETGLTGIDGLAGEDTLYLSGSVNLDFAALPQGVHGIEQVWMENGAANTLTLTTPTLMANGDAPLTVRMDAGDAVVLDGRRFEHDAGVQAMVIGGARADVVTGTGGNDVLIGGAGADTFTWLSGQGGRDLVLDFSLAQDDRLDLTGALRGFTAGHEADYLRKFVDGDHIVIAVDRDGHGDFGQADLTITLANVHATDPITVITAAGQSVL